MSNIYFKDKSDKTKIEWITFSDGTESCKLTPDVVSGAHGSKVNKPTNTIVCAIENGTRDIVRLALFKDALSRLGVTEVHLQLPYMPQARADRVFEEGNALPIKVFADFINSLNFASVVIYDPHSDVTPALLNNCIVQNQKDIYFAASSVINKLLPDHQLCAPDLGATKKVESICRSTPSTTDYIQGIKIRDTSTGKIIKSDVVGGIDKNNVLIVDDICDGGASFIHLAKVLKSKGAKKVGLLVTHGIFAKGLYVLADSIDYVFCANIVGNYVTTKSLNDFNNRSKEDDS